MPVLHAGVVGTSLSLEEHLSMVDDARQGATATFIGTVRNHDPEVTGEVQYLDYSAHPSAADTLAQIAHQVSKKLDTAGESRIAITHRIGRLYVGDVAIIAAVSSPHRALAFELCAELVEEVKRSLPIWKMQRNVAGDDVWSGLS